MSDIILANLTTTSGDKILETGGMLYITASADHENCIIMQGRHLEIGFPYSDKKDYMTLFYGEQANNIIDWKLANTTIDPLIKDELMIEDSEATNKTAITAVMRTNTEKEAGSDAPVFFIVEEMPEFPGGQKGLQKYLEQNVHYPYSKIKDKIEGKVLVTFVIDSNGNTHNIKVTRGLDKMLDKVAVYVVSNFPKWKPGMQGGKPVAVSYTIPITFSAKEGELTSEEIKESKDLEEKLKDFKFDIDANRFYANNKEFDEFEKKVKNDDFKDATVSEVKRYIFSVTLLGWINCDRFYNNNNPMVNFFILTDNSENMVVNAILQRFKSLIPATAQSGKITFNNIASGEKVTIVALKSSNNKIFLSVKENVVAKNGEIVLDFQPVTMELLKKEMEKLNKFY